MTIFRKLAFAALALWPALASADDFSQARAKIQAAAPGIPYSTFCSEQPGGEDKIACRVKSVPSVGFLVCQQNTVGDLTCKNAINGELLNLQTAKREQLPVVDYNSSVIGPVQCAKSSTQDCWGYMVHWITNGTFANIDDAILHDQIPELSQEIISKSSDLTATRSDLNKVAAFMTANHKYSQVCDLQGFYLRTGGFKLNDIPQIYHNQSTKPDCGTDFPSYDKELAGIEQLIALLKN